MTTENEGGAVIEMQDRLAAIWAETLAVPEAAGSHFFEVGGDSLLAARVSAAVGEVVGRRVPLRLLLEHPEFDRYSVAVLEFVTTGEEG
jgi:hypothetical protein